MTTSPSPTTPAAGWYPTSESEQRYWNGHEWLPAVVTRKSLAVSSDKGSKGAQATVAWILTVLSVGYMLPWAIAATRGKSNSGAIGVLNLLLGWTIVGWVVTLVMACGAHQRFAVAR